MLLAQDGQDNEARSLIAMAAERSSSERARTDLAWVEVHLVGLQGGISLLDQRQAPT